LTLAFEYPMRSMAEFTETHHVMQWFTDATTFSDGKRRLLPNFDWSSHYSPTGGLSYFDYKTLGPTTDMRLRFATGGPDVIETSLYLRPTPEKNRLQADAQLDFLRRDDMYYDGAGPPSINRSRYQINAVWLNAGVHIRPVRMLTVDLEGQTALKRFGFGHEGNSDPTIDDVFCLRLFGRCVEGTVDPDLVPGFRQGTQYQRATAALRFDTSRQRFAPRTDVMAILSVDYSHGFGDDTSSYFRLHGVAGVSVHVWRRSHVILFRAQSWIVEPINDTPVPFSELPLLGAIDVLRGFQFGSMRDQSLLAGTLEYRWPIWMYAEAALFADYGGVYAKNFGEFTTRPRYWDLGIGIRVMTRSQFLFRFGVAYGFNGGGWQILVSGGGE
jgi:hypothetical protein